MARQKDYFSFESIRDREGNVVCYHVTMIGTIEADGVARMRTDFGADENQRMAFGRLTVCGLDKKIKVFTDQLNCRIYYHSYSEENGAVDIISFSAKDWRADEVYALQVGDRVLIEGRAYIRPVSEKYPDRLPEVSVTMTGMFLLGHKRFHSMNSGLIPQK